MATVLIGLGANLGDRAAALDGALAELADHSDIEIIRHSAACEYQSIGGPAGQPAYLNSAALLRSNLAPHELWRVMAEVETRLGRTRDVRWGARTIDLDLLLYDVEIVRSPSLSVPHPRLAVRRFVLEPAAEVAGGMTDPATGWTINRLLEHLNRHPRYVALAGPMGVGKTQLARDIVAAVEDRLGIPAQSIEEPIDDNMLARFYADPAGRAAETELEFLRLRAPLVTGLGAAPSVAWTISDFWFGQALAYGELWLPPEKRAAQREHYQALATRATPPKLLVMLDAPPEELRRRIARRGRPYEQSLTEGLMDQLSQNIHRAAETAYAGPMLRLSALRKETVIDEVAAAIAGMQ